MTGIRDDDDDGWDEDDDDDSAEDANDATTDEEDDDADDDEVGWTMGTSNFCDGNSSLWVTDDDTSCCAWYNAADFVLFVTASVTNNANNYYSYKF